MCNKHLLTYSSHISFCSVYSFHDEGEAKTLLHIRAEDNAEPAYNMYEMFHEACEFIGKLHVCF